MSFLTTLEAARSGSEQALGTILLSLRSYLFAIATRRLPADLRGRVHPSSLVEETYLRACKNFGKFQGVSEHQLMSWLRKILIRCMINLLRRPEFQAAVHEFQDCASEGSTPDKQAADRESRVALASALAGLPARDRQAIELRQYDRLRFEEVGRALGCSAEAARKAWARALAKLKQKLKAQV